MKQNLHRVGRNEQYPSLKENNGSKLIYLVVEKNSHTFQILLVVLSLAIGMLVSKYLQTFWMNSITCYLNWQKLFIVLLFHILIFPVSNCWIGELPYPFSFSQHEANRFMSILLMLRLDIYWNSMKIFIWQIKAIYSFFLCLFLTLKVTLVAVIPKILDTQENEFFFNWTKNWKKKF